MFSLFRLFLNYNQYNSSIFIEDSNKLKEYLVDSENALIYFYHDECRISLEVSGYIENIFQEIRSKIKENINLIVVNIGKAKELSKEFSIIKTPTFKLAQLNSTIFHDLSWNINKVEILNFVLK
jgi:Thioredoxin